MSTAKAGVLYLKNRSYIVRGGSTITQQLIRNIYLSYEKSIERKAKEIFIALQLEKKYTKRQILEFYLNNVNYANGYYGIASAAKGYFNKKVAELSLEEAAFLTAIPNNPTYYNPLNNIKHTVKRKNLILQLMFDQGYISEEEYLKAANSPIHFYAWSSESFNYETSYAVDCSVRVLMEKQGFKFKYRFESNKAYKKYRKSYEEEYQEAKHLLYTGGYKIYTTLRPKVQHKLQKIVDGRLSCDKSKMSDGIYGFQGAATVIDNSTGKVIAIVGGRSQNFKGMITFNRAYQAFRQPGSTFKPLAVYTPAFEYGYKPDTIVNDEYSPDGPKNSDGDYLGKIPLRTAVEKSKNVVAWNLFNSIGPKNGLAYVQQMMFSHIVPDDYYLSSSLGGLTYGASISFNK